MSNLKFIEITALADPGYFLLFPDLVFQRLPWFDLPRLIIFDMGNHGYPAKKKSTCQLDKLQNNLLDPLRQYILTTSLIG